MVSEGYGHYETDDASIISTTYDMSLSSKRSYKIQPNTCSGIQPKDSSADVDRNEEAHRA